MRQITMTGAVAALAAMSLDAQAQAPAAQCVPALVEGGFELTLRVEGQEGPFRLTCRDGTLIAVPVEPPVVGDGGDDGAAAEAAIAETAAAAAAALEGAEALDQPPADLTAASDDEAEDDEGDRDTGINAAGVAGQTPAVSVTEAARDARAGRAAMAAEGDAAGADRKPPVAEAQAAAGGEPRAAGEKKHEERLADAAADPVDRDMVAVPLLVIGNAELALPDARFDSVAVEGDGEQRLYGLRGTLQGEAVSVTVTPAGNIVRIDRTIDAGVVPDRVARIAEALLPEAEIETITLSSRDNYMSFFIYEGQDARGRPFELEIRSDGRGVEFKRRS
jgi:hypothetical protein